MHRLVRFAMTPQRVASAEIPTVVNFFSLSAVVTRQGDRIEGIGQLVDDNIMDSVPFLEFKIDAIDDKTSADLLPLSKDEFDLDRALATAAELRELRLVQRYFESIVSDPSEDLLRSCYSAIHPGGRFSKGVR
ncbi:MAG: hypothetical protein ACPG4T_20380, partial [Nannocystaceae bacterium]